MYIFSNKLLCHAELPKSPITADIFLTAFCNNHCSYCTYNRWGLKSNNYINIDNFKLYTEKLLAIGVKGIILTGGGEPTVNPDFDKITDYLETNNIEYGINTNFNILKFIKPVYLKVSLDGYSENSYKKVRGVAKYNKVRDNIIKYAEWKAKNSPNTLLSIQCVADSVSFVKKFYKANKDLPVDTINIRPIESTAGDYYKCHKTEKIIKFISRLSKQDSRVCISPKWQQVSNTYNECYAKNLQISLNEKGEVLFCCHKPYEIIGHILDTDIMEKKIKASTNMAMCDIPCRLSGPNETLHLVNTAQHKNFI